MIETVALLMSLILLWVQGNLHDLTVWVDWAFGHGILQFGWFMLLITERSTRADQITLRDELWLGDQVKLSKSRSLVVDHLYLSFLGHESFT
jgi:hypothetical protein